MRKSLLGLFVGFILLLGFSYSWNLSHGLYVRENGSFAFSPYDNNFDISVIKYGNVLTNQFGIGKPVLYFSNGQYFLWKYSDYLGGVFPYLSYVVPNTLIRYSGFPLKYALCDGFVTTSLGHNLGGCTVYDLTSDSLPVIQSFMNSVTTNDYYGFKYEGAYSQENPQNNEGGLIVCFSSAQYSKSLCFGIGNSKLGVYDVVYPGYVILYADAFSGYGVTMPSSFSNLDRDIIDSSPGQGGNIDGSSSNAQDVSMSGNLVYNTCTNGYVINKLEYSYGSFYRHTCYAGTSDTGSVTSDYQLSNILPGNGLNIIELYKLTSNGQSRNDWFLSNTYAIQKFREGRLNANPFLGSPIALYSYFDILYDDTLVPSSCVGDDPSCPYTILNYCKLLLYSDYNSPYEYGYFGSYCSDLNNGNGNVDITTGDVGFVDGTGELLPPGYNQNNNGSSSGSVVAVDWSGVLSGDTNRNFDGKTFINDVYQKFQAKLIKPYYGATIGIIPNFILVFLFALILFRFLQH